MVKKILKAKHWQLFLLMFGIPMVLYFIMLDSLVRNLNENTNPNPFVVLNSLWMMPIIMIAFTVSLFLWFWSVAIGLQGKIPESIKKKTTRFKLLFFIPLTYLLLISFGAMVLIKFLPVWIARGDFFDPANNPALFGGLLFGFILCHLFSVFSIFYCMYFVAKTFKTAELQHETGFSDFAGEFFLIWFYPIGI
ncbi:MAG: hypothetical protein IT236_07545, partial [Bacteroidia bacterium]|nr:hypothetical protein [Bacteroidia bacterium]